MDQSIEMAPRETEGVSLGIIRRIALISLMVTVTAVGGCSSLGLETARGDGAEVIARDPATFVATIGILVGPLVALQAVPLLLAWGRPSRTRATILMVVFAAASISAVLLAYVAFVGSYAGVLCSFHSSAAQDAKCAAGTGGVAAFWGVVSAAGLPAAIALRRSISQPSTDLP